MTQHEKKTSQESNPCICPKFPKVQLYSYS